MRSTRGIATVVTALAGLALLVAGPIMVVKGFQGQSQIRTELSAQHIVFPASEQAGLPKAQTQYAGQRVTTGPQAKAYSDMVETHVREATGGLSYSQVSSKWIAGGRTDAKVGTLRQTAFMGESLRGGLMGAYQAWELTWLVIGLGLLVGTAGIAFFSIAVAARPVRVKVPASPEALRHHEAVTR
ncbi:MAG: hypothetical protein M3O55_04705 [Actinomycetota bacterium]|nr:hypothetical protein [Actinomycetota bacterium]